MGKYEVAEDALNKAIADEKAAAEAAKKEARKATIAKAIAVTFFTNGKTPDENAAAAKAAVDKIPEISAEEKQEASDFIDANKAKPQAEFVKDLHTKYEVAEADLTKAIDDEKTAIAAAAM